MPEQAPQGQILKASNSTTPVPIVTTVENQKPCFFAPAPESDSNICCGFWPTRIFKSIDYRIRYKPGARSIHLGGHRCSSVDEQRNAAAGSGANDPSHGSSQHREDGALPRSRRGRPC